MSELGGAESLEWNIMVTVVEPLFLLQVTS